MNQEAAVRDLDLSAVGEMIEQFGTDSDAVIPILLGLQDTLGYLPIEALQEITERTEITPAQVYGVATFYAQFRLEPLGEHIVRVCHGTSCHVRGIVGITETICDLLGLDGEGTTADRKHTLEKVACLGCCSLSPVIMVDDKVYGSLTRRRAERILKQLQREDAEQ
jgi:NADH-quinone oxidoreductase subunit E